ncbi:MAG: hypothetical protein K8R21_03585 [Leptospira sp.]|nr:hypothetical protein [Leptospira sp.]
MKLNSILYALLASVIFSGSISSLDQSKRDEDLNTVYYPGSGHRGQVSSHSDKKTGKHSEKKSLTGNGSQAKKSSSSTIPCMHSQQQKENLLRYLKSRRGKDLELYVPKVPKA